MKALRVPRLPGLPPASRAWLLAHELRMNWRNVGGKSIVLLTIMIAIVWVAFHATGWVLMRKLSLPVLEKSGLPAAGLVTWFVLSMVLSVAIAMSVNALFDRGDLDLLLSSPIEPEVVFTVRGLGVAIGSLSLVLVLVLPFVHMGIYHGQWGLLAAYPVLLSMGLGAAGLAFAATLGLVRLMGARKARVAAQILSAVTGAALFLVIQSENMLPQSLRANVVAGFKSLTASAWFDADSVLWWPVRAVFGDPLPAVTVVAAGLTLFWFVIRTTCSTFLSGTQEAVTCPAARAGALATARPFRAGVARNVLRKELLLIRRDPNLIAQSLLQGLYLVPLVFLLARKADMAVLLAPSAILVCSTLAGNLAWITVSGEEAPDLIGAAPVDLDRIRWLKVLAALLPVLVVALPFVIFYGTLSLPFMLIFSGCLIGALVCCAATQVWGGTSVKGTVGGSRDLKQRYKQSRLLNALEAIGAMGWAAACYGLMSGFWWAVAGLVPGFVAPLLVWSRHRRSRPD